MAEKDYFAIGLMSGTSLDGLDLCYCKFFKRKKHWEFDILHAQTVEYESFWRKKLANAIHFSTGELFALHSNFGFYLGEKVSEFITKNKVSKLDVISSHGHTVHHQPNQKFTFQLGDGRAIKIKNNFPIVYDFRMQDILLGGQGAPLVPIGDELLFSQYSACLNLGGFSNISFKINEKRIAFDIAPVNTVLNYFAQKLSHPYDDKGSLAQNGKVDKQILKKLNELDFYKKFEAKSLGIEFVNSKILPLFTTENYHAHLATFTEHIAEKIAEVFNFFKLKKVLITGGGAFNEHLLNLIKAKTASEIILPNEKIIQYKEALIFAFMGVLRLRNEHNVLSAATGADRDHVSGILV